jgi:hypothetical protein
MGEEINALDLDKQEAMFSSFQKLADMSIKYGDDFFTFEGMEEYTDEIWSIVRANTGYKGSLSDLINDLKNVGKTQKEYNNILEEYNDIIDRNNLAIMKLQLKEMQQRHGLRRADELKMKRLQISNLKARIEMKEKDIEYDSKLEEGKNKLSTAFNEFVDRWEFQIQKLAGSYIEDYTMFDEMLKNKTESMEEFQQDEIRMLAELEEAWNDYYATIAAGAAGPMSPIWGLETPTYAKTESEKRLEKLRKEKKEEYGPMYPIWGFQRGTYAVPYTGLHLLHRGEQVVPKGSKRSGGTFEVKIAPITVNARITQETDTRALGSKIGEAIAAGFIDGVNSEFKVG